MISTAVLLSLLGLIALYGWQRRMIYFPLGQVPAPAAVGLPHALPIAFTTDDGLTLNGWFVPVAAPPTGHTVLVFNGNAGNRAFRAPLADRLARRGIATLLMDYRGYGENAGSPSEEGLALDARAAQAYLAHQSGVDASRIVYFGESLGTSVAVRLAREHRPFALILRSPFTSLVDVGRWHYPFLPVRWMLRDRFDSLEVIPDVTCPVLVIAGDRDSLIPAALSNRLYDAILSPKQLVTIAGADHNDDELLAGSRVIDAVVAFLKEMK